MNFITGSYKANDIEIDDRVLETIGYDIDSIEAIYHIRKGEQPFMLTDMKAFLLTTNRNLIFASKKFHQSVFDKDTLQACFNDVYIGTYLWSRKGIQRCENMMETRLIADCSVAMEPPQHAISKYCEYVQQLKDKNEITETEYIALKCYGLATQAAQPILMSVDEYTYKDLHDVMEEIRQKAILDEKKKFNSERETFQEQITALLKENNIKEEEYVKYRDMALKFLNDDDQKKNSELEELILCAQKAEKRLKYIPHVINAVVNVIIQVILFFFVSIPWLSLTLKILIPLVSLFVSLTLVINMFKMHDRLKYWLIFRYKKKLEEKRIKGNVLSFLEKEDDSK